MRYICTSIVATLALAGTSLADTITVCSSGCDYTSINAAIDGASNGDFIQLSPETYYEGEEINTDGKAITLSGAIDKSGAATSILDGDNSHRVLICQTGEGADTVFENLVIRNGYAVGAHGGGMYNQNCSPTLAHCTFEDNSTANLGGGMYNIDSSATVSSCTFISNSARMGGGMANIKSDLNLTSCWFVGNGANPSGPPGRGGGMYNSDSSPTLTDCIFYENSATSQTTGAGGGMYNTASVEEDATGSSPAIVACTFEGNSASSYGGGLYNFVFDEIPESTPMLWSSRLCGNTPTQIHGDWTDNGSNTLAENCPDVGGCCIGADCITVGELLCVQTGGTWLDSCHDCGEPTGACCVTSGCDSLPEASCTSMGGTWLGEDVSCDDCPAACAGDTDGNGVVNIEDLLNMMDGWGACP